MSVLQCGSCLKYTYVSCAETLFAYILIAITRNLSGNRSQTPISSYKMYNPRVGVRFQNYPYVCILKSRWRTSLAVRAMLTDHIRSSWFITTTHRRAKAHCTNMRPGVCNTLWRATANFYILSDGCRPPLFEKPPSITVGTHAVACDCKLLHAVTTVTKHFSLRNPSRSQLFTFDIHVYMCTSIYIYTNIYTYISRKTRENGSENRFLSRVRSAAMRECEP